jgi:hypothetical protein
MKVERRIASKLTIPDHERCKRGFTQSGREHLAGAGEGSWEALPTGFRQQR